MSLLRAEDSIKLRELPLVGVAEVTDITAVADVAGSLSDKYFILNAPVPLWGINGNGYYVWIRVNGIGNDPEVPNRRKIIVDVALNAADTVVALAIKNAIHAQAEFNATVIGAVVTVTNAAVGAVEDADDGVVGFATGFTIAVVTPGISEVDKVVDCKKVITAVNGSVISVIADITYDLTTGGAAYEVVDSNFVGLCVYTKDA